MLDGYYAAGDASHLLAYIILFVKIWKTNSCAGISGKSQILFAIAYLCRYLDLFITFGSDYDSFRKILFIEVTLITCYLIYSKFHESYDSELDSFWIEWLIIPAYALTYVSNYDDLIDLLWIYSIYLESVAILPQFHLIWETGKAENTVLCYLVALTASRGFYSMDLAWRYVTEQYYSTILINAGVVQTVSYIIFFCVYAQLQIFRNNIVEDDEAAFIGNPLAPVYIISGKHALDMGKTNVKISPVLMAEEKTAIEPIDEKTPKTGLASFTEFSMSLTPDNAALAFYS